VSGIGAKPAGEPVPRWDFFVSHTAADRAWAEWVAMGFARKVLPVRVEDCERPGLLEKVVSIDLFDRSAEAARQHLLDQVTHAIAGRAKPAAAPAFPDPALPPAPPPRPTPPVAEPAFPPTTAPPTTANTARPPGHPMEGGDRSRVRLHGADRPVGAGGTHRSTADSHLRTCGERGVGPRRG
jgi:hypothetical protein